MDIVLAMLANDAKIEKRWTSFPYNVERNVETSEATKDYALYRYIINNAIRYPKEWIDNKFGASVIAKMTIKGKKVVLKEIKILNKTEELSESKIFEEVEKTLKRASHEFPENDKTVTMDLPIEWRMGLSS